jgi:hypothetical protein
VEVPVGQTRSVCQQISEGDLSRCRICLVERTRRRVQAPSEPPGRRARPTSLGPQEYRPQRSLPWRSRSGLYHSCLLLLVSRRDQI